MAIGPQLPSHLQKRRHDDDHDSDSSVSAARKSSPSRDASPEDRSKRRRVMGPTAPPAPLDERPPEPPEPRRDGDDSSSEDDDGFGPSLPPAAGVAGPAAASDDFSNAYDDQPPEDKAAKRDEWMMVPPKQDDLAARMDPTKIRARGFNTGKGAKGPGQKGGPNSAWMETPDQKRQRLANEVLGVSEDTSVPEAQPVDHRKKAENEEKARKIKEYNEKHRSKSLYHQHQGSDKKQKEDDPSARGFDYEKDMGGGMKIGHAQKREMLKKASDFGSRFSSGSYL